MLVRHGQCACRDICCYISNICAVSRSKILMRAAAYIEDGAGLRARYDNVIFSEIDNSAWKNRCLQWHLFPAIHEHGIAHKWTAAWRLFPGLGISRFSDGK